MIFTPENSVVARDWIVEQMKKKASFFIRGAGSRLPPAHLLPKTGLCTEKLNKVKFFHPEDMVISVEAGMRFEQMSRILARENMCLPVSPWYPEATIGGMIAANDFGPERMMGGGARDHIIGIEYINGSGHLVKAGGRVVKNVTGYDLSRMMIGSMGGLGLITTVNFRVLPQPANPRMLTIETSDTRWVAGLEKLHLQHVPLDLVQATCRSGTWKVSFGISGKEARQERLIDELGAVFGKEIENSVGQYQPYQAIFNTDIDEARTKQHLHGCFSIKTLLNAPRLEALAQMGERLICHPISGDFHLFESAEKGPLITHAKALFQDSEGYLVQVVIAEKNNEPVIYPKPGEWGLIKKLQEMSDPAGVFKPDFGQLC